MKNVTTEIREVLTAYIGEFGLEGVEIIFPKSYEKLSKDKKGLMKIKTQYLTNNTVCIIGGNSYTFARKIE